MRTQITNLLLALSLFAGIIQAAGQGTAFSYQGKLSVSSNPANGLYDVRFTVCDALTNGYSIAGPLTNTAIGVSNGLFAVTLDFGAGVFTGPVRWLQLDVRTNGPDAFTALAPREPVMPVPYAVMANSASNLLGTLPAAQLSGTVPASQLSGTMPLARLPVAVVTNGATGVALSGTFSGNGEGVIGLNPANLSAGTAGINISGNAATATTSVNVTGNISDFQVSTNIARLNGTNSFTGTNNLLGVTVATNANNVFKGAFTGNGLGLTNVPGSIIWQSVSVGGISQQMQPNIGYLANYVVEITFFLPTSPKFGDVVRVTGSGYGGWKVTQNAGQSVQTGNFGSTIGTVWIPRESNRPWGAVASSSDGSKLVVVDFEGLGSGGKIYTSTDSGVTWTSRESNRYWTSVASSADGSKLIAVDFSPGRIYTSTDSGVTWTPRGISTNWQSVASSADGSKLVAVVGYGGQIYTSTDSGLTWTPRDSSRYWWAVASSSDGSKLVAVVGGFASGNPNSGQIYTSTDSGVTWTPRDSSRDWQAVASSADGNKLVAVAYYGSIYTSTDSGVTWTPRNIYASSWAAVASSSDGSKLVASGVNGNFTSTDSGVTWTPSVGPAMKSIASSSDGSKLVAVDYQGTGSGGKIYTSVPTTISSTTSGTAGYLQGGQNSAIELQYIGNGQWLPLSYAGTIRAY